jgi:predicted GIY-YIG superfamily endonuclease
MPSKVPHADGLYLICFDAPVVSANGKLNTRHYIVWSANLRRRIEHHRANVSDSRFMRNVNAAGVTWVVSHLWLAATRSDERRLKSQKHPWRLCPR